ncbi:unnamed protein product [Cylicocyclus nassatus]|uniref:Uncharacterized protein n=1 Tax=Cylicocyclus nassatus TaxID=53992 RepID=A0AA36M7T5_CYLNA|nr:unnamed protein product [Cylicocyclus nassatus]
MSKHSASFLGQPRLSTLIMDTTEKKKIFFEEADRPPPSYYDDSLERMPLKKIPFQTPDPEKWLKAPEFVPRTKMLADAFAPTPPGFQSDISPLTEVPFVPVGHLPHAQIAKCVAGPFIPGAPASFVHPPPPFPPMVPMPPAVAAAAAPAMPVIPNGYTVNITNLNRSK